MIIDTQTNFVYFSDLLRTEIEYQEACSRLTAILDKHQIPYGFLKETKDIWCRDYMPIQKTNDEFLQFCYDPSYLKDDPELLTETSIALKENNIPAVCSPILVDGGNVIKWHDKVIMTSRIFSENRVEKNDKALVKSIEELLEAEVIIIPDIKNDLTGHVDGYMRCYNDDTVLVNELGNEYKYWREGFLKMIKRTGLKYIEIPWSVHKDKKHPDNAIGCYINFLEVSNLIILTVFEVMGNRDQETVDLFRSLYPDKIIETVNINEIGRHGGLMNCITWNILK